MLNLANVVCENAIHRSEKVAVRMGDKEFTYAQLDVLSNKVANYLVEQGIVPGDKVALACPNVPYFPIVYYGILKAGAVVVPQNVLLKGKEISYLLSDSESKAYFVFEGSPELPMAKMGEAGFKEVDSCKNGIVMTVDPAAASPVEGFSTLGQILATKSDKFDMVATNQDDTAVILYTSGTTGKPKGAELTHLNIFMNMIVTRDIFSNSGLLPQDHNLLLVLPLFHSFGQVVCMNATIYSGAEITLLPRFDAKSALGLMVKHHITTFAGVPTMYWALLNEYSKFPEEQTAIIKKRLKLCVSGGAALPGEVHQQFEKTFGVQLLEGYGLSETSPLACFQPGTGDYKIGSIGLPVWGVQMKVVDSEDKEVGTGEVGEILIRGHNIMKGYYKRPEATEKAMQGGWFHSGDMGKKDEDGYYYIVDRVKDMIIRGGFNVYPREIEEMLLTHPDISLVAVVGIPHDEYGEEIKAFVVLKEGKTASEEEVIKWSKENMDAYKSPRQVELRKELPMGPTGKVLKRELRS